MKISDKNKGLIPKDSVLEEYFEYDEEFYASVSGPDTEEEIEEPELLDEENNQDEENPNENNQEENKEENNNEEN
jgi:hypothetical protein